MRTVVTIGIVFAILRIMLAFIVPPETFVWRTFGMSCFKDASHLFIGGLVVAWWYEHRSGWNAKSFAFGNLFWFLCVIETVVAIASRIFQ